MAVIAQRLPLAVDISSRAAGDYVRFRCDTQAELPTAAVMDGDSSYAINTKKMFDRVGGAWVERGDASNTGGGGATPPTEIEVNVSYPPIRTKTFTIVAAAVTTGSKILAYQSGNAPTGKNADDNEMDPFICSATPGNGQFTLILSGIEGMIAGPFKVLYTLA